jgi:hypothetical protein
MSKKNNIFANENTDDEPIGALAFTDFSMPSPILQGEDAERFYRIMEENERKAAEKAKQPMTKAEAEKRLTYMKMIYEFEKNNLEEKAKEIKALEDYINKQA